MNGVQRRACLGVALLALGCRNDDQATGRVGVFYGGQLQELQIITLDPVRGASVGVELRVPAELQDRAHQVRYEVVRPGPLGRRVTEIGELEIAAGRAQVEQVLPIDLRDSVGLVNVRVLLDGQVVVDRAIDVRKP